MARRETSTAEDQPPGAPGGIAEAAEQGETFASPGYVDCLQYCLQVRGHPYPKALLMGVSGESFRLCFDRNDPERGLEVVAHNPLRAACAALGFAADVVYHRDLEPAVARLMRDAGEGGGAILHTQVGWVVVSAEASGERLSARLADGRMQAWEPSYLHAVWEVEAGLLELGLRGYYYFVVGEREREPDPREAAMASLRRGVRLLMRKSRLDGCATGLVAYEEIRESILRKHRGAVRQTRNLRKYALWNAAPLTYLRDSRRSAAAYLTMIQPEFDEEAREHLGKAADLCRQAAQALGEMPTMAPLSGGAEAAGGGRAERKALRRFALLRRRADGRVRRAHRAEEEALLEIRRGLEAAERKDEE